MLCEEGPFAMLKVKVVGVLREVTGPSHRIFQLYTPSPALP